MDMVSDSVTDGVRDGDVDGVCVEHREFVAHDDVETEGVRDVVPLTHALELVEGLSVHERDGVILTLDEGDTDSDTEVVTDDVPHELNEKEGELLEEKEDVWQIVEEELTETVPETHDETVRDTVVVTVTVAHALCDGDLLEDTDGVSLNVLVAQRVGDGELLSDSDADVDPL